MNSPIRHFDLAVLRTFLAVHDLGTLARAGERVGRSESAVSLQLKGLEAQVGQPLFRRAGRRVALTAMGDALVVHARRLIALNDETWSTLAGAAVQGTVRLGVAQDFAETWLPAALVRLARSYPAIRLELTVDRSPALARRLAQGGLDLGMTFAAARPTRAHWTTTLPMRWIGPRGFGAIDEDAPLPLAIFDPPCFFRAAATSALEAAGLRWQAAFTSPTLAALWAAVSGGLGITVRTPAGLPSALTLLGSEAGLPPLPDVALVLDTPDGAGLSPAASHVADVLVATLEETLGAAF